MKRFFRQIQTREGMFSDTRTSISKALMILSQSDCSRGVCSAPARVLQIVYFSGGEKLTLRVHISLSTSSKHLRPTPRQGRPPDRSRIREKHGERRPWTRMQSVTEIGLQMENVSTLFFFFFFPQCSTFSILTEMYFIDQLLLHGLVRSGTETFKVKSI